jgi:tRNA pseudouridine38-40 synthase
VQGELQKRLTVLFRTPDLRVSGTSRTDAGVHALDQHVSFQAEPPADMDGDRLRYVLNRWLPPDIRVQHAERREDDFSARFSSTGKAYTYCVYTGEKPHPFVARFVWHYPRALDLQAVRETCSHLTGEQDYSSFAANPKRPIDTHVRRVMRVDAIRDGDFLYFNVVGESFLYKMVRSMVGYAVHVGAGRASPADTLSVLAARDRCAAADSAPAQGLFLAKVFFDPDEWQSYTPLLPPFSGTL